MTMDFQSAMETFAEAWVAANTQTPLTEAAEAQSLLLNQASLGSGLQPSASASLQDLSKRRDSESADSATGSRIGLRSPSCSPTLGEFRLGGGPVANSLGRNVPVHCVVERVPGPQSCSPTGEPGVPTVEQDSFAIVPHGTPFNDLVRTALLRLGYSASEAVGAKGAIQLKNWKPLAFDQITDAPEATVGEILGELFTVATLRVRLYSRPRVNAAHEVKEKLLQVLLAQSHTLLVSSGCPIDQSMLSALTKGRFECDISEETRKKFDQWYLQQIFHHCRQVALAHQQQQQQLSRQSHRQVEALRSPESSPQQSLPHPNNSVPVGHHHHSQQQPQQQQHSMVEQAHQHQQQPPQSSGRTRIRTSFDPELELPKLHRWFTENQHPSRLQIQQYVKELNSLESRRGRKPLDVNNVVYWFKNARAAYKRAEQRYCNEANGIQSPALPDAASDGEARNGMADNRMCGPDTKDYMNRSFADLGRGNGGEGALSSHSDVPDDGDLSSFTLDLSLRGSCREERRQSEAGSEEDAENDNIAVNPEESADTTRIKEEPKDSGSEVSGADSDESDDMDMDASDDIAATSREEEGDDEKKPGEEPFQASNQHKDGVGEDQPSTPQSQTSKHGENSGDVPSNAYTMNSSGSPEERRKRNRTFIDPMTEVPRLEQWFSMDTHPVHRMIVRYTEDLNSLPYRQKFPKLEPKNIQFWFKNRRAKCKRLNLANNMKERSTQGMEKS